MITEVELLDFLSHRDTRVAFGPGMNVIVGPNGAGKSSVVDAITFALFGKHTRRVNKSLVRHGAPSAVASVAFEAGGRTLKATRKIKGGVATPVLQEASGETWANVAAGERRQMGESTTREIEAAVGMNFERMQIASIIRQGELSEIVHEAPKDFKLRINDIAGISDMDAAEGHMADLLASFRAAIRERHGSDDTQLQSVMARLEEARAGAEEAGRDIRRLGAERDGARADVARLEGELGLAEEAEAAAEALSSRKEELAGYARQRGSEAAAEAERAEGEAGECRARLAELDGAAAAPAEIRARIDALEGELAGAREAEAAAEALSSRKEEFAGYARQRGSEAAAEAERAEGEVGECRARLAELDGAATAPAEIRARIDALEGERERAGEAERARADLESRKRDLFEHAAAAGAEAAAEEKRARKEAAECGVLLEAARTADGLRRDLQAARERAGAAEAAAVEGEKRSAALAEKLEIAGRLSLKDGKCPVCNSRVDRLNPLYAREHIEREAAGIRRENEGLRRAANERKARVDELSESEGRAREAKSALEALGVSDEDGIKAMLKRAGELGEASRRAAACAGGDWRAGEGIDAQAKKHCEAIAALEAKAGGAGGRAAAEIEAEIAAARRAGEAAAFLAAHSVAGGADIEAMEARAAGLRGVERMAAACAGGDWRAGEGIDAQARAHCEAIAALEAKAGGAGGRGAAEVRAGLDAARGRLDEASKARGAAEERARALSESIARDGELASELEAVAEYVGMLEAVRDVYRRDGDVATSMRTWALEEIARGSTDHLSLLGTRINRITLSEKGRNVTITCHSGSSTSEVDSLSGGEQVCVALALRLGMARVSGSRSPSYVILDEPTAHLDEERRRALARVLTNLAGTAEGRAPMQFIMITHDAEIFGEAPVERAYRFERGANGTVVSEIRGGA